MTNIYIYTFKIQIEFDFSNSKNDNVILSRFKVLSKEIKRKMKACIFEEKPWEKKYISSSRTIDRTTLFTHARDDWTRVFRFYPFFFWQRSLTTVACALIDSPTVFTHVDRICKERGCFEIFSFDQRDEVKRCCNCWMFYFVVLYFLQDSTRWGLPVVYIWTRLYIDFNRTRWEYSTV